MKKTQEQISISDVVKKIQQSEQSEREKLQRQKLTQEEQDKINLEHACWIIRDALGFSSEKDGSNYKDISEIVNYIMDLYRKIKEYKSYKFYSRHGVKESDSVTISLHNFDTEWIKNKFNNERYKLDGYLNGPSLEEFTSFANEFLKLEELLYERLKEIPEDHEEWLVEIGMDIWKKPVLSASEKKRIEIQMERFVRKYGLRKTALRELCEQIK